VCFIATTQRSSALASRWMQRASVVVCRRWSVRPTVDHPTIDRRPTKVVVVGRRCRSLSVRGVSQRHRSSSGRRSSSSVVVRPSSVIDRPSLTSPSLTIVHPLTVRPTIDEEKSDVLQSIHTWRLTSKTCIPPVRIASPVLDVCVDRPETCRGKVGPRPSPVA
jgi:hypothetical protein